MPPPPIIILLGLRGSGKTTLANKLAPALHRTAIDLDDVVRADLGFATIAEAFKVRGEHAFRAAESQALARVLRRTDVVLALGGGTPTAPGATDMLRVARQRAQAMLIYLSADADTLRRRLASADMSHRPSLTGADPLGEISSVHAARDPLYRMLADHTLDVSADHNPDVTLSRLLTLVSANLDPLDPS